MKHSSMASGMCIQLRRVIDKRLPPDFSLGYARTLLANVPSYRRLRFIRCESRRTGLPACGLLRARCPLDLTGMMAVFTTRDVHEIYYRLSVFAVAIPSFCCAGVTKLSPEDRKVLQDSSRFHEVYSTS